MRSIILCTVQTILFTSHVNILYIYNVYIFNILYYYELKEEYYNYVSIISKKSLQAQCHESIEILTTFIIEKLVLVI